MFVPDSFAVNDGRQHRYNMTFLAAVALGGDGPTFKTRISPWAQATDEVYIIPSSDSATRTYILWDPIQLRAVITSIGIEGTTQVPAIIAGWEARYARGEDISPYETAARSVYDTLRFQTAGDPLLTRCIGHSFGGAMCYWLDLLLAEYRAADCVSTVWTYGAPRPTIRGRAPRQRATEYVRVFLRDDPVPRLPPTTDEIDDVWVITGVPTARAWQRWYQPIGGYQLNPEGSFFPSTHPRERIQGEFIWSLAGWVSGSSAFGAATHPLSVYNSAVQLMDTVETATEGSEGGGGDYSLPPPPVLRTAEIEASRDTALAELAVRTDYNRGDAARGVITGIPIVQGTRFRGIMVGGKPWVYYGDKPVLICRTKRTRRALVRRLNATL